MFSEAKAKIKHLRVAPRKARIVCDLVKGKKVQVALDLLRFTRKKCAVDVFKLINSALANAQGSAGVDVDNLYVNRIFVDQGVSYKRSLPRARGSASPILKRTSHITVVLAEKFYGTKG